MTIAAAERLKREWTDREVEVRRRVPELRRFEGLIGVVKTVNMNGRCLVEFKDRPDIGWYDIAPEFLVVSERQAKEEKSSHDPKSAATTNAQTSSSSKPTAIETTSPSGNAVGVPTQTAKSASPLDLIRRQGAVKAAAENPPQSTPAASQASGDRAVTSSPADGKKLSPLDLIRQQGAAKKGEPTSRADQASSAVDTSQVKSLAGSQGSPSQPQSTATKAVDSATGTASTVKTPNKAKLSPIEMIRQQQAAKQQSGAVDSIQSASSTSRPTEKSSPDVDVAKPVVTSAQPTNTEASESSHREIKLESPARATTIQATTSPTGSEISRSGLSPIEMLQQHGAWNQAADTAKVQSVTRPATQQSLFETPSDERSGSASQATSSAATPEPKTTSGADDLTVVEGIGPKISGILNSHGITTWAELAKLDPALIREWLDAAGPRYRMHDPTTWPKQALLASEGHWEVLKAFQDVLSGGRDAP